MSIGNGPTAAICLLLAVGLVGPIAGVAAAAGGSTPGAAADSGIQAATDVGTLAPTTEADVPAPTTGSDVPASAIAQDDGTNETTGGGDGQTADGPVDPAVVDEIVQDVMDENDVAGATVAVVEGGEVVHAAGYGEADADAGAVVDPNETSFMVGSVSKLFVWTLVMQGVEDGTLEFDEPVGTYLDDYSFEGDDQVTLEHLATHSAGYEDRIEGLFVADHEEADDWEGKLEREMPAQVREPGETIAYSNHGAALAGLVVQQAYDRPFEELVDEEIFAPLGMDGATFEQPVPEGHEPLSEGHVPSGDGHVTQSPTIVGVPPAGSMSATATDMGAFAAAMLQGGVSQSDESQGGASQGDASQGGASQGDAPEDVRVLENESVEAMFEQRATNHPGVEGVGFGYMQGAVAGEELVWHDGATEYFHTLFALFPEHDVGLYVSFNTPAGGHVDVLHEFARERFGDGGNATDLEPDPATADRADRYEGEYRSTGYQTTHEKLLGLGNSLSVTVTDEGYLELASAFGGSGTRWVEVEPGVFELAPDEEPQLLTTLAIEDGTLYRGGPTAPYEQVSWYESATVQFGLAAGVVLALLSTLVVWPASAYRRRGWGRMREHLTRPRLALLGAAGLLLAFLVGLVVSTIAAPNQFVYGYTIGLRLVLGLLVVFAGVALAAAAFVGVEWARILGSRDLDAGTTDRWGLAYLTVLAVAGLVFVWQLWYWNLLSAAF